MSQHCMQVQDKLKEYLISGILANSLHEPGDRVSISGQPVQQRQGLKELLQNPEMESKRQALLMERDALRAAARRLADF